MSWLKGGKKQKISGSAVAHTGANAQQTVYAAKELYIGKHEWKIKLIQCQWIMIGIATGTNSTDKYFWKKKNSYCYGSNNNGDKADNSKIYHNSYGKYGEGDIITAHIDLDKATFGLSKNGSYLGVAFSNIQKKQKYRLVVGTYYKGTKFEMLSYVNLSDEQKEETIPQNDNNYNIDYIAQCTESMIKQFHLLRDEYSNNKIKQFDDNALNNTYQYFSKLNNNMQKLEIEFRKCQSQLLESQNTLKQCMIAEVPNYETASFEQIEIWLNSLENGRYKQYVAKLIAGCKKDKVSVSDLSDLDQGDLKQFGVDTFKDRKDLKNALQSLKSGQPLDQSGAEAEGSSAVTFV